MGQNQDLDNAPMDQDQPMGNEQDLATDPTQNNSSESDFDTNFDAGVEADEDEDPKKYIQQLTGKLSQTLGSYNNEKGEPDVELGKYVAGMVVKQAVKGMDEKDKKEIIKKINMTDGDDDGSDEDLNDDNSEDLDLSDGPSEKEQQIESYIIKGKDIKKLLESIDSSENILKDKNLEDKKDSKIKEKESKLSKPFKAPKFKK